MTGWRLVATEDGSPTFAHPLHGEACHSDAGAWTEARERYAAPCRLRERAAEAGVVRVLDVGTGLGLNAAAALAAVEGEGASLDLVTFESDLEVLRATLRAFGDGRAPGPAGVPLDLERSWAPVRRALALALEAEEVLPARGVPLGPRGRLRLHVGDARATIRREPDGPRFDAVFLDPFSPSVAPELWEADFLAELARRMAPGSVLSTYTASLRVRTRLAAAGLAVGPGPRVGRKAAGTLASPDRALGRFDRRTERRLARRLAGARGGTADGPKTPPTRVQGGGIP